MKTLKERIQKHKIDDLDITSVCGKFYAQGWNEAIDFISENYGEKKMMDVQEVITKLRKIPWMFTHPTELRLVETWFIEDAKREE